MENIKQIIKTSLLLRLLDIQEFFTHQWLISNPNDNKKLSELINIRKKQLYLKELIIKEDDEFEGSAGGGRGTIKGLRAKDDPNIRNKGNSARKMTRR